MKTLVKIASYNIHSCIGTDKEYSPERISKVINGMNPHIIGLQEIDTGYRVKKNENQLNRLKELTGMEAIEGPTIYYMDNFYGNAILTKLPVVAVRRYDLTAKHEPRGLLDVDLQLNGNQIRFMVTHLGLHFKERRKQVKIIVKALYENRIPRLTILCGDFNDIFSIGPVIRILKKHLGKTVNRCTYPSAFPILPLDKIWIRTYSARTCKFITIRNELTRKASDHLPIYVEELY